MRLSSNADLIQIGSCASMARSGSNFDTVATLGPSSDAFRSSEASRFGALSLGPLERESAATTNTNTSSADLMRVQLQDLLYKVSRTSSRISHAPTCITGSLRQVSVLKALLPGTSVLFYSHAWMLCTMLPFQRNMEELHHQASRRAEQTEILLVREREALDGLRRESAQLRVLQAEAEAEAAASKARAREAEARAARWVLTPRAGL